MRWGFVLLVGCFFSIGCGGSPREAEWGVGQQDEERQWVSPSPPAAPRESCEVVLKVGLLRTTARISGLRSQIRQGVLGNDAVLENRTVKMVTGAFKQVIGEFADGEVWYREGPIRTRVDPVQGGSTTVYRGALRYSVTSSGCKSGEVYVGALHLVAYETQNHPARVGPPAW